MGREIGREEGGAVAHVFEKVDESSNRRTGGRRESMSEKSVGAPHTTRQCESAPFMTYAGAVRGKGGANASAKWRGREDGRGEERKDAGEVSNHTACVSM